MSRRPPPDVLRAASELQEAPLVIQCRLNRPELVHCVVRPRFRPRGAVRSSWSREGRCTSDGCEADDGCSLELGYTLDEYQQLAGEALREAESVVVSAPTTSGKTTVALLALGLALRQPGRAVFCAPIKALSNQMFSEFHGKFPGKVGLLTGDHCIGHESPILVMTTEIFRCLLQNDANFVLALRVAVFDEVHFLSDLERGPTWEECMALLPPGVPIVCLSATMSNPVFLAGWLAQIKCSPTHSIQKKGRPVPLRHFAHPIGGDPAHLLEVLDADGKVHRRQIDMAAHQVEHWHGWWHQKREERRSRRLQQQAEWQQSGQLVHDKRREKYEKYKSKELLNRERLNGLRGLLTHLLRTNQTPMLVFCFSKAACNHLAQYILDSRGFMGCNGGTTGHSAEIRRVIESELKDVPGYVRFVEQVVWATEQLLPKGIGVHHAGLVPVLRELTEILFKRGLLDVLVCTETFGMGLNMPARTVVFSFRPNQPLTKFDGIRQRALTPTEYMQMSGRAGRRKQDTHGTAVLTLNDPFERQDLYEMLGKQSPVVVSHYEMQVSSALQVLRYGRGFMEWFGSQTLRQFEAQGSREPVLHEDMAKLRSVMQHEELDLIDDQGDLTQRGHAICGMNCGDVLIIGKLLAEGCFDEAEPLDLLAYLTVFILERPPSDGDGREMLPSHLAAMAEICEGQAAMIDRILAEAKVERQCDDTAGVLERLRTRTYLVEPFRSTWLSGSSFDEAVRACRPLDAGTLVRTIRRLDECAAEVLHAAKRLRNRDLADGLMAARKELRRGLPFMDSLYFPKELRNRANESVAGLSPPEDDADVDCWTSDYAGGGLVQLDPCAIGFCHNTVAMCFRDGRPLRRVLWQLLRQEEDVDEFASSMRVVFYRGRPYTLGNRRLAVLRMFGWMQPEGHERKFMFKVASPQEAQEWGWNRKFTTGCFRGARAVIRSTGEVIGISLHDSMCSLEEEDDIEDDLEDGLSVSIGSVCSEPGCGKSFWDQFQGLPTELKEVDEERMAADAPGLELQGAELAVPAEPAEPKLEEARRVDLVFSSRPLGMTPCKGSDDSYVVASVSEMKPAARGGVRPGWRVCSVAGQPCAGLGLQGVQQLLKAAELPVEVAFEEVPANRGFCTTCQRILVASLFTKKMLKGPPDRRRCEQCCLETAAEGAVAAAGATSAAGAAKAATAGAAPGGAAAAARLGQRSSLGS